MAIHKIKKRNGTIVDYDQQKIKTALTNAIKASHSSKKIDIEALIKQVYQHIDNLYANDIPSVENIQDIVEKELIKHNFSEIAKNYILYRQKHTELRQKKSPIMIDVQETIEDYLGQIDWRISENANQGYSLGGMILNTSGKVTANYWLSYVYPKHIGQAHRNGDIHIHDLSMFSGYCAGWSLRALLEEGFNGVANKVESNPPQHLSSAVSQMVNFLGTLQNEWAGAQAFSSFDTYLAPFVRKKKIELHNELTEYNASFTSKKDALRYYEDVLYKYVYQNIQSFVFNLNIPSRWGTQTPFTNITLDWVCPTDLQNKRLLLGGEPFEYTFGELQDEMDLINRAFIEIMMKGDAQGRTFTFPIPTYNITKDFDWNDKKVIPLFEMTAKYGTPYFQNFINSDLNPSDVRSMCCRLQLDLKELRKRGGGLFGSAEMTGSIGVVTINLARIGKVHAQNKQSFLEQLHKLLEISKISLELKREVIEKWTDRGLFPYTKRYLGKLNNHFSTIGINGMNEAIRNFTNDKETITSEWGQKFAKEVMDYIREQMSNFQEETGNLYNLEATPGEGTTYRFAKEDKKQYKDILQAGTEKAPYYTNSTQIPVGYTDDIFEALDLQDELQKKYTGGTVFHGYMNEKIESGAVCAQLVKKILTNYKLPYITITPTFSICPKHGYLAGEYDFCPKCDTENNINNLQCHDDTLSNDYKNKNSNR